MTTPIPTSEELRYTGSEELKTSLNTHTRLSFKDLGQLVVKKARQICAPTDFENYKQWLKSGKNNFTLFLGQDPHISMSFQPESDEQIQVGLSVIHFTHPWRGIGERLKKSIPNLDLGTGRGGPLSFTCSTTDAWDIAHYVYDHIANPNIEKPPLPIFRIMKSLEKETDDPGTRDRLIHWSNQNDGNRIVQYQEWLQKASEDDAQALKEISMWLENSQALLAEKLATGDELPVLFPPSAKTPKKLLDHLEQIHRSELESALLQATGKQVHVHVGDHADKEVHPQESTSDTSSVQIGFNGNKKVVYVNRPTTDPKIGDVLQQRGIQPVNTLPLAA